MARWGMVIDLDKCVACQACTVACRVENNIPFAGPEESALGRAIFWNEVIVSMAGNYPHPRATYTPRPCMHCDNSPCGKVCPVKATYRNPEGIVAQIPARCIGCRICMCTCPYTARSFNWYAPHWPEQHKKYLNPDVSVRPKGVVEKCVFCHHRLKKARDKARLEGREMKSEGEYVPACVQTCPAGARYFGDLDDPDTTVFRLARSARAFRLLEELGTHPKVFYLKEGWGRG